jgi:hypothetical protein
MRMHIPAAVAALCLAGLTARPAEAQGAPRIGGQMSFAQDVNAGLGLRLELPVARQDVRLETAFDYFFPDSPFEYWELNGDLAWGLRLADTRLGLYLGGGLDVAHSGFRGVPGSGSTDLGANLLVGLRIPTTSRLTPFVELRPEFGGGNRLVLSTGVIF